MTLQLQKKMHYGTSSMLEEIVEREIHPIKFHRLLQIRKAHIDFAWSRFMPPIEKVEERVLIIPFFKVKHLSLKEYQYISKNINCSLNLFDCPAWEELVSMTDKHSVKFIFNLIFDVLHHNLSIENLCGIVFDYVVDYQKHKPYHKIEREDFEIICDSCKSTTETGSKEHKSLCLDKIIHQKIYSKML